MGMWSLVQIVFDIFLALGLGVCILRVSRRPQDDPRLSRALQLLQSKIAILEDLADRVDAQGARLGEMLAQKDREIQDKIDSADGRIQSLRDAVDQGIETVRLAQSSLKAEDILEQKSSLKYAHAARLAHEGHSVDAISQQLGLPRTEVEFISKVNRDSLRTTAAAVSSTQPQFAQAPANGFSSSAPRASQPSMTSDFAEIFDIPTYQESASPLSRLGQEFRRATQYADITDDAPPMSHVQSAPMAPPTLVPPVQQQAAAQPPAPQALAPQNMPQTFVLSANGESKRQTHLQKAANAAPVIRRVEFPRIDSNR